MKTQFDIFIEQERAQHLKELDDIIYSRELEKYQINNDRASQITLLEKYLSDLKLIVVGIDEFKVEAINVNNNLKDTQASFFQGLSKIQQIYYDLDNENYQLMERVM